MTFFQIAVLAVCLLASRGISLFSQEFDNEWESWKITYGRNYSSEKEEAMRRLTWQQNLEKIVKHNLDHQQGLHSYRLGMNAFGDMEHKEFTAYFNGLMKIGESKSGSTFLPPENIHLPDSVDWRTKGYVTKVKNQKQCGSCWAFSATGSLEGQHFKKAGKLVSLSEQNLIDCSGKEGNRGCKGGLMDKAFQYVIHSHGIDTEQSYPYKAEDEKCKFKKSSIGATCTGYADVKRGSEDALHKAVATVGPISVAIDASQKSFQFYESGVYNEPHCSSTKLDHGVLAVGYSSTKDGKDYWIVKNSWGKSWGMKGYIWMSRNKHNQCGIATQASYPLV